MAGDHVIVRSRGRDRGARRAPSTVRHKRATSALTIPGTAFTPTDERMIRFSFANLLPDEITELGARLADWRP